jgi:hypothetical protein
MKSLFVIPGLVLFVFAAASACNKGPENAPAKAGEVPAAEAAKTAEGGAEQGMPRRAPVLKEGQTTLPEGHPAIPAEGGATPMGAMPGGAMHGGAAAAPEAAEFTGVVVETMDAAGYTYVQIQKDDKSLLWMAGPGSAVKKGDKIHAAGMLMPNFHSKTLNRTFPEIYFVNSIDVVK